ncbi:response regulator transcription factor [Streptomyces sp. NBC_00841]|uniref:response regulator transcription factor n=1 Tax=Streptomyces sp. NBC_00841 TaxID=2975847 RepID=UPI003FA343F4
MPSENPPIRRRAAEPRFAENTGPESAAPQRRADGPTGITEREREVLTLVGRGMSDAEISATLFITVATVKTYVTRLLTRFDARDRVRLVIIAYETGMAGRDR